LGTVFNYLSLRIKDLGMGGRVDRSLVLFYNENTTYIYWQPKSTMDIYGLKLGYTF
jgi:hypothetical protein